MRRSFTVAIVAVVAGALAVAGLGSLVLVQHSTANQTRRQLVEQAQALAGEIDQARHPGVLALVVRTARLYSAGIVALRPDGTLVAGLNLPAGIVAGDLAPAPLLNGDYQSGIKGSLAFAVVPVHLNLGGPSGPSQRGPARALARAAAQGDTFVEVATRRVPGPAGSGLYFAVAAMAALLVAAGVAGALGRRITQPLARVEEAARRIAEGDLDGRVVLTGEDYPEILSLGRSINTMTESLSRAQGLERQFLMSISHDLRTPLTSIRGWAEAIADGAAEPARAAGIIGAEAGRLERLVQDLLDLARIDARHFSTRAEVVDLAALVGARAEAFRPGIEEASLELRVDCPLPGPAVSVDPDRLAQVVANLIENAYKYARGEIRVSVASSGDRAWLAVEDDGPGLSAQDSARAFDRLYQGRRAPTRPAGSGLGLTIVKELTEAMGGSVELRSPVSPEGGSRFAVGFPWPDPGPVSGWW